MKRRYVYGSVLFDSIVSVVTSQAVKDVSSHVAKEVTKKALTKVGNRGTTHLVNKIIPPPKKSYSLNDRSKAILNKYNVTPIEEYVKK